MKHKTILQWIAAFALAVLTAFSMLPAATAYAAGEAGTVTFTYCYDSDGNMILYNGETNVDGYTALLYPARPPSAGQRHSVQEFLRRMECSFSRSKKSHRPCPSVRIPGQLEQSQWKR